MNKRKTVDGVFNWKQSLLFILNNYDDIIVDKVCSLEHFGYITRFFNVKTSRFLAANTHIGLTGKAHHFYITKPKNKISKRVFQIFELLAQEIKEQRK
jgi:hypothetical protein